MHTEIKIRPAKAEDIKKVFDLSNDPEVRAHSIRTKPISWQEHQLWFTDRIAKTAEPFYIVEDPNGSFIAQVRLGPLSDPVISLSISKSFRGQGLAAEIIKQCSQKCRYRRIYAVIKKGNLASLKAFQKAGYKPFKEDAEYQTLIYKKPVYIIAEMSANHCGDFELAKKIIKTAHEIGADAVKIQTYTADTLTINCSNEEFQIKDKENLWNGENLYSLYQKASTPWQWQAQLKQYADEIGIDFFSTPFDYSAVDFLEKLNVPLYKIASFEAFDYPLIKYTARLHKPMIISTGVSSLEEIEAAVAACHSVGNYDITLLKCTSAYPAKPEDMNLLTLQDMQQRFRPQGVEVGLSDHSMSLVPVITAVALGATVIEKHFTLDRALGGADSGFSLNKEEFAAMVQAVRETEKTLGHIDYSVNEKNRKFARSLYVVQDIKKGDRLTPQNIRSIRPSNGLHPKYYEEVLGKTAARDLPFGTPLKLEDIQ